MKLTDELKELVTQSVNWAKLEVEYLKLTAMEKLILLAGMMVLGGVVLLLLIPVILMLLFALAQVFIDFMPVAVAYVCVAGILLVLLAVIILLRRPLIINPMAKLISKILLGNTENKKQ